MKRALISVSDKTGILEFAKSLVELEFELISTGGTYAYLSQHSVPVTEISDITKFPEILKGRVKTLHPMIHGGILACNDQQEHLCDLEKHNIAKIDLVCVNLYPFESTVSSSPDDLSLAIENIDIGGVTLIRAAAKNFEHVIVVIDHKDYDEIIEQVRNKNITSHKRMELAFKSFNHTSYYDALVANYFAKQLKHELTTNPDTITIPLKLKQALRYGENPHQQGAFYGFPNAKNGLLAKFTQIQGKELSYNNLLDADTALECVKQYSFLPDDINEQLSGQLTACVIVKHANPCGVALGINAFDSYQKAYSCDPISSFGGIIAFNGPVDLVTVNAIIKQFVEVIIATSFSEDAIAMLATKPNVRVLTIELSNSGNAFDCRSIGGGLLLQTPESQQLHNLEQLNTVSAKKASIKDLLDLYFAWTVVRFVKSNAMVLVKNLQTIGIGPGQTSRVDSTKIAISKALQFGFDISGSYCASDAFLPFSDNVDCLAKHKVAGIIQPGGSVRDNEVLNSVNEYHMVMVFTNYRVFRH